MTPKAKKQKVNPNEVINLASQSQSPRPDSKAKGGKKGIGGSPTPNRLSPGSKKNAPSLINTKKWDASGPSCSGCQEENPP